MAYLFVTYIYRFHAHLDVEEVFAPSRPGMREALSGGARGRTRRGPLTEAAVQQALRQQAAAPRPPGRRGVEVVLGVVLVARPLL